MRSALGVLIAAAVGIHCSSPAETPDTSAPAVALPEVPAGDNESPRPTPATSNTPASGSNGPGLDALVRAGAPPVITSTVTDAGGAVYATGTFTGNVTFESTPIKSRGNQDVFLMKLDRRGNLQWVRAVGSVWDESAPRVTLEGTSVTLVGITKGEMDCGSGPLQRWSSETFFVCIFGNEDGAAVSGGVFPTGAP